MSKTKKAFLVFLKIYIVSFIILLLLQSCGSSRGCTTKAGNYNTVNR